MDQDGVRSRLAIRLGAAEGVAQSRAGGERLGPGDEDEIPVSLRVLGGAQFASGFVHAGEVLRFALAGKEPGSGLGRRSGRGAGPS